MEYLVMECGFSYAIVLDQDGRFLKVANLGYEVGQTVERVIEEQPMKPNVRRYLRPVLSMAACLALLLGAWRYVLTPVGTVRMQINPDVQLSVNRLDYVLKAEGLNADGRTLLSDYHTFAKTIDRTADELADRAMAQGYLSDGGHITVTAVSGLTDWQTAMEDRVIAELQTHLGGSVTVSAELPDPEPVLPTVTEDQVIVITPEQAPLTPLPSEPLPEILPDDDLDDDDDDWDDDYDDDDDDWDDDDWDDADGD